MKHLCYTTEQRPEALGSDWRLRLYEDKEEVGEVGFPTEEEAIEAGDEWLAARIREYEHSPSGVLSSAA